MANTYKYLDESGLTHVHSLIDTNKKLTNGVEYIVGTQTADTNAWTGVSTDIGCKNSTLYNGKVIIYHLPKAGTSSSATLNLTLPDGTTTGAKTIYRLASSTVTTTFASGCDILMVWNGTNWKVNAYVDSNTNTIGYQVRTNSALWKNKTGYSSNRYTLLFEVDGGLSGASTTIATGTSKTPVNFKYIPGGVIKYYSVSGAIANNSNFSATGLWDVYTANLSYTFNTGSTLTAGEPVYMRCVVNSDGTLTPNYAGTPSHPIVQELPNTADGYVYVYLGQAYSTTNIELLYNHPIYEFKNGKIREWQYDTDISGKQDTLVSGTNIKTINGTSILGSGDISVGGGTATDVQINGASIVENGVANLLVSGAYSSTNKLATMSQTGSWSDINTGYLSLSVGGLGYKLLRPDANNKAPMSILPTSSSISNDSTTIPTTKAVYDAGYITGITSSDVTTALGYTPYNSTNPNNYISGITSSMVTSALGYTPYNSTNPNGYTSNTGTITGVSINNTSIATSGVANIVTNKTYNASTNKIATMSDIPSVPSAGTSASAVSTTASGGSATTYSKSDHVHNITSSTITSALGYTPYNSTNPNGYTSNTGTITGVKMNGSTIASSGVADLGTVLTAHQSIKTINNTTMTGSGNVSVQPTLVSGTNIKTIKSTSLLGSGDIPINDFTELTDSSVQVYNLSNGTYKLTNSNPEVLFGNYGVGVIAPAYLFVSGDDGAKYGTIIQGQSIWNGYATSTSVGNANIIAGDDTGWQTLTLASGFSASTGSVVATPQYRKIGNHVFIRGTITFTRSNSTQIFATMSNDYLPGAWVYKMACVQGTREARIGANPSTGQLFVDWIYPTNSNTAVTSGTITWLDITMDWFTD